MTAATPWSLERLIQRVLHIYWRFARPATLGVRAAVIDTRDRVFLVKHSYVSGWHLPGGGVEAGETLVQALTRELHEEGNVNLTAPPRLHGIFFNRQASRRDHVALFVVREFRQDGAPEPNREIIAHGFFGREALPAGTTRATRARLAEIFDNLPIADDW